MSGITLLTASIIQNSGEDIKYSSGQNPSTQKWRGFIHLYRNGRFHRELISTDPVFDSSQEAERYMKDLIEEIRSMDLSQVPGSDSQSKEECAPATDTST